MSRAVFIITLQLLHCTTQNQAAIIANCNDNVTLPCAGTDIDSMDFLSVVWYKFDNQRKLGIIRKGKNDGQPRPYNFTRSAMFGEKYSLFLTGVKPEDSGTYDCAIGAKVGQQNQNFSVDLKVHKCVTQNEVTTMTTLYTTQPIVPCHTQVKDVPVAWSITGFVAVSLVKIFLCVISIWVIRTRSSKRRQHRW